MRLLDSHDERDLKETDDVGLLDIDDEFDAHSRNGSATGNHDGTGSDDDTNSQSIDQSDDEGRLKTSFVE